MRLGRKIWTGTVVLCAWCALWAQSQPHVQPAQPRVQAARRSEPPSAANTRLAPQLINADEGLAILGAALAGRYKVKDRSDCSHLVHGIYEKAGFPYKYERSWDLYAGIDAFRQVARPQPGDVVAWRGHAGIVVNPAQHTFFSALRSGFGVQPYDSDYWKGRGRPHFFRYVKATEGSTLAAANRTLGGKAAGAPVTAATNRASSVKSNAPVEAGTNRPSSVKASVPAGTGTNRPPSVKTSVPTVATTNYTPSLKPAGLRSGSAASTAPTITVINPPVADDDPAVPPPEAQPAGLVIPSVVAIRLVRPKPEQVSDALWQQFRETGDNLQSQDVFQLRAALVTCEQVQVQKVHVKGNSGWVDVRVLDTMVLSGAKPLSKKRGPVQRWTMERSQDGWELALPQDTIYIPRKAAARILAHQLAGLTDTKASGERERDQKVQLTRWLSLLLDDPSGR